MLGRNNSPMMLLGALAARTRALYRYMKSALNWNANEVRARGKKETFISRSRQAFQSGDLDKAEYLAERGLEKYPSSPELAWVYANVAMHRHEWVEALNRWMRVHEMCLPKPPVKVFLKIEKVSRQIGRIDLAKSYLNSGAHHYPERLELKERLAEIAMEEFDFPTAVSYWQEVLVGYENRCSPSVFLKASRAFIKLSKYSQADFILEKGEAENPENVRMKLARFYLFVHWLRIRWFFAELYDDDLVPEEPPEHVDWLYLSDLARNLLDTMPERLQRKLRQITVQVDLFLAEKCWNNRRHEEASKALEKAMDVAGCRVPENVKRLVVEHVSEARMKGGSIGTKSGNLLEVLSAASLEGCDSESLLNLYQILRWNGLFRAACLVRTIARNRFVEPVVSFSDAIQLNRQVRSLADCGRVEVAIRMLTDLEQAQDASVDDSLKSFLLVQQGELGEFRRLQNLMRRNSRTAFAQFLEGKSVAVVGPAPGEEHLGKEIDAFDVVVRFNYLGRANQGCPEQFGERTDISYYNDAAQFRYLSTPDDCDFLGDLVFLAVKNIRTWHTRERLKSGHAKMIGQGFEHLFVGHLNFAPLAVLDLLSYNLDRIKLFNVNFFLSRNPYATGYAGRATRKDRSDLDVKVLHKDMLYHDSIGNRNLVRNLWNAGVVEVDPQCLRILKISEDEYFHRMEEIYGPFCT